MNKLKSCDIDMFLVKCKVDTGITDPVDFLVATFYKEDAAADYVDFLNQSMDSLFVVYYYEEEIYAKK